MKKNQKFAEVHIPSDLYPDILSRLPVKSLLRFRCVSKSWLALVDDAGFARLHLKNFKNNTDETHLLVFHKDPENGVVLRRSDTFETVPALGTTPTLERMEYNICSVDGLILLTSKTGIQETSDLILWNPSIRKFLQLPSFPGSSSVYSLIGFGYDASAKDYKIVLLKYADMGSYYKEISTSVIIYTLGANSWKTVEFQVEGRSTLSAMPFSKFCPRFYFQGCLYIISIEYELVVFDLSTNGFSTVDRPKFGCRARCALVDDGRLLAMFGVNTRENCFLVLETESMSWTRRYTFQLKCSQIVYINDFYDILVPRHRSDKIAPENAEKKKEVRSDQAVLHGPQSDEYKNLNEKSCSHLCFQVKSMFGYVESLILHK